MFKDRVDNQIHCTFHVTFIFIIFIICVQRYCVVKENGCEHYSLPSGNDKLKHKIQHTLPVRDHRTTKYPDLCRHIRARSVRALTCIRNL